MRKNLTNRHHHRKNASLKEQQTNNGIVGYTTNIIVSTTTTKAIINKKKQIQFRNFIIQRILILLTSITSFIILAFYVCGRKQSYYYNGLAITVIHNNNSAGTRTMINSKRSMNSTFSLFSNTNGVSSSSSSSSFVSGFGISSSLMHYHNPTATTASLKKQQSTESITSTETASSSEHGENTRNNESARDRSTTSSWGVKKSSNENSSQQWTPLSTATMHKSDSQEFYGAYASVRAKLDYTYHSNYKKSRQILQDEIINDLLTLNQTSPRTNCNNKSSNNDASPWIAFTAGVMGAGKTHTIRSLAQTNYFPLQHFVIVDPDAIRQHLPEYKLYMQTHPELAGERTRKEAGYISEIAMHVALQQRRNVLVDGSLRSSHWYHEHFFKLKQKYHPIKIAIVHITASIDRILERVKIRSEETGRIVPQETIIHALENVPRSIDILTPLSDFFCEISNDDDHLRLVKPYGMTWDLFRDIWDQSCAIDDDSSENNIIAL